MRDINQIRSEFPALSRKVDGRPVAYLDGPGGTQVHANVVAAMARYMEEGGSNLGGAFAASRDSERVLRDARAAVADLLGATPREIAFGQNMTSLTYQVSRALGRTWNRGDNVVVTRLDHDANVAPWMQAAADAGVEVRHADFHPDGCVLTAEHVAAVVDERTRLVAFNHASNAVGTMPPVAEIVDVAHAVGALTYVDAVHYAPHGLVDVRATDVDFLAASAYKWFGPHTGCLFGKRELLESVTPYKLRPSSNSAPDRWETGTQSFESLAGVTAAVDYIASLGEGDARRERIVDAYRSIREYESALSDRFLAGVSEMSHVRLFGLPTSAGRAPTFAVEIDGMAARTAAAALGEAGIFAWSGDYYAVEVMQHLGKQDEGLLRIGFVHYNTHDEVDRVLDAIGTLGA